MLSFLMNSTYLWLTMGVDKVIVFSQLRNTRDSHPYSFVNRDQGDGLDNRLQEPLK
jgi:hypothetical protein